MWRATWKSLLAKKVRLALTTLSVVLGVGFVAGTYVLTDTMSAAFDEVFQTAVANTDVIVRSESAFAATAAGPGGGGTEGREPIQQSVLDDVVAVEGVAAAHGEVAGYAQFVDPATDEAIGGFGPPTLGFSWDPDSTVVDIREGEAPQGSDEVAVDAGTAEDHGLGIGQRIEVLFEGPAREFTISAIVGFGDADNLAGATLALFDLPTGQQVFGKVGVFDAINVIGEDDAPVSDLRARVQQVLPDGLEAVTATTVANENAQALSEGLGFFKTALLVFALISLFVGSFIIFNTFAIITAQRTRELGLLRALGASRTQVLASVLGEAAVIGLIASAVGLAAGVLIAIGLQALLSVFGIDLPSTSTQILPRTVGASFVVGTVVTVASAILPARRASKVAPVQALQDSPSATGRPLRRRLVLGIVVTVVGGAMLAVGLFGGGSNAAATIGTGTVLTFLGIAVLAPLFARPFARAIGVPVTRLGVPGKLGRENAMRNPRRTASTASALMIGLGLVAMVAILASSLKASFNAALEETLKADLTLTTTTFTPFSPEVADLVRAVPEVEAVSEVRQSGFRFDGRSAFMSGVDPQTIDEVALVELDAGRLESLGHGSVLVHRDVAEGQGLGIGDPVTLSFPAGGDREFVVGGILADDRLLGEWVISVSTYEQVFTEQLDAFVLVKGAGGVTPSALQGAVEQAVTDYPNVEVQDQASFREKQAGFIDQLLGLVTALLALAILIAVFGIVNTLGLSIYERTRELGLLRAVGMTRRQVRSMIRWESVIIAVFGALLGIAIGVLFGWALQRALVDEGLSELAIPGTQLVVYLVIAGIMGVLAAVIPARRAAKLNVLQAISYE